MRSREQLSQVPDGSGSLPTASPYGQQSCPCYPEQARHVNGHKAVSRAERDFHKSDREEDFHRTLVIVPPDIPSFNVKKLRGARAE